MTNTKTPTSKPLTRDQVKYASARLSEVHTSKLNDLRGAHQQRLEKIGFLTPVMATAARLHALIKSGQLPALNKNSDHVYDTRYTISLGSLYNLAKLDTGSAVHTAKRVAEVKAHNAAVAKLYSAYTQIMDQLILGDSAAALTSIDMLEKWTA